MGSSTSGLQRQGIHEMRAIGQRLDMLIETQLQLCAAILGKNENQEHSRSEEE